MMMRIKFLASAFGRRQTTQPELRISWSIRCRSRRIVRGNLAALAEWVEAEPLIDWVKPEAGTTALLKFDLDMSSREFCVALLKETGVMFTPGSALGMEGCVRIGYANGPEVLKAGLARVSEFLNARGG